MLQGEVPSISLCLRRWVPREVVARAVEASANGDHIVNYQGKGPGASGTGHRQPCRFCHCSAMSNSLCSATSDSLCTAACTVPACPHRSVVQPKLCLATMLQGAMIRSRTSGSGCRRRMPLRTTSFGSGCSEGTAGSPAGCELCWDAATCTVFALYILSSFV